MTRLLPALLFALLPAMETVAMERHESTDTVALGDSVPKKRGLVKRFLDYFNDANKPKEYKKFDFSIIGGLALQHRHKVRSGTCGGGALPHGTQ